MHISLITPHCHLSWLHKFKFNDASFKILILCGHDRSQCCLLGNQENMHIQYSNTVINILRFFETHILTCYRPTMKQIVWGSFERPRGRACSRTCVHTNVHACTFFEFR
jgi:hypothetical protein